MVSLDGTGFVQRCLRLIPANLRLPGNECSDHESRIVAGLTLHVEGPVRTLRFGYHDSLEQAFHEMNFLTFTFVPLL